MYADFGILVTVGVLNNILKMKSGASDKLSTLFLDIESKAIDLKVDLDLKILDMQVNQEFKKLERQELEEVCSRDLPSKLYNRTFYKSISPRKFTFEEARDIGFFEFLKLSKGAKLNVSQAVADECSIDLNLPKAQAYLEKIDTPTLIKVLIGSYLSSLATLAHLMISSRHDEPNLVSALAAVLSMMVVSSLGVASHISPKIQEKMTITRATFFPGTNVFSLNRNCFFPRAFKGSVAHEMKHYQQDLDGTSFDISGFWESRQHEIDAEEYRRNFTRRKLSSPGKSQ